MSDGSVPKSTTLIVRNNPDEIDRAQSQVIDEIERLEYPKASIFAVRLSLHEAMSNAFRHGHSTLPPDTPLKMSYLVTKDRITLSVEDQGPGFNPHAVPDPTLEENLERGSGRGLLLIRAYMASAEYNEKGNRIEMVYERPHDSGV